MSCFPSEWTEVNADSPCYNCEVVAAALMMWLEERKNDQGRTVRGTTFNAQENFQMVRQRIAYYRD